MVVLGASYSIAFSPAIHPQCPRGSDGGLIMQRAHATLSDQVKLRQDDTEEGAPPRKVRVEDVLIESAPDLEESIRARIHDRLPENGLVSDSDWIDVVQENAEEVLQDNGYFGAKVSARARVLSQDDAEEQVSVYCQVAEGQQYHLDNIGFTGVHAFPPSELRSRISLSDGELFDLSKLRKGIEAWTSLYGTQGYLNFTASPDIKISDDRQLISVVIEVEEDKQFTVGSVEVLGLDQQLSSHGLKIKLKRGDVFNSKFVEDFFKDNKPLLPAKVSHWRNVEIKQDAEDDTVAIVFDLRPCPQPTSQ
jgi:outer membrane translocation and assembly module TamA